MAGPGPGSALLCFWRPEIQKTVLIRCRFEGRVWVSWSASMPGIRRFKREDATGRTSSLGPQAVPFSRCWLMRTIEIKIAGLLRSTRQNETPNLTWVGRISQGGTMAVLLRSWRAIG